jgi:hypothetical protein
VAGNGSREGGELVCGISDARGWLCVKAARERLFEVLDEGGDEGALRGSSRRADHTFATAIPRAFQHAIA